MNQTNAEEFKLIQKAAAGESQAVRLLFDRYADLLYAYIHHQTDCPSVDVDDIWQETITSAFRSLAAYRGQSRFFTWLCSIAKHKIIDHYRKSKKDFNVFPASGLEEYLDLLDTQILPEDAVMNKEIQIKVVEGLAQLPEDYRSILIERYSHDLSIHEIAGKLNKTDKAVESMLARARQALRRTLIG